LGGDEGLKILESCWRMLDAKVAVETLKFVVASCHAAERRGTSRSATVRQAICSGRPPEEFSQARASAGNVCQGVFLAGVHGDVVFAGTTGIDKFDFDVLTDTF
jgi:hypothetical protein